MAAPGQVDDHKAAQALSITQPGATKALNEIESTLGAVLFEMLAGAPPYQASDAFTVALMHVTHPLPELPEKHAWLTPAGEIGVQVFRD